MNTFKKVATPLPLNFKLQSFNSPLFYEPTKYRSLVGKLNFLTTRPTEIHYQALIHTLNYVATTAGQGILLKATNNLCFKAFSDSDWGACLDKRRSATCYFVMFGK